METVQVRLQDNSKLKVKIAEILEKNREEILDQYYDEYCRHISLTDRRKRDLEQLREICIPVRRRFSLILDRFLRMLKKDSSYEEYNIEESEQDKEFALRFVVPGRHQQLDAHGIVKSTERFHNIATEVVLSELKESEYSSFGEDILRLMNKLTLVVVEDLWVGSVVGFRLQHARIRQLLSKLMMTQEEERQRLWGEIHDEFLQALAVIPLKLEIIEKLAQKDVPSMKRELNFTKAIAKKTIKEIRELGHGFNIFYPNTNGFSFTLKRFIKLFENRFRVPVTLEMSAGIKKIKGFPAITLFRIIQEGLNNIGKHSKASYASVTVNVLDNRIMTRIEDDGIGFDIKEIKGKTSIIQHLGLAFMKERTELLNGYLQIDSIKDMGTTIIINLPMDSFSDNLNKMT